MVTNNSDNISSQGVVYYNGTGTMSGLDGSTAGFILTSNGTGVAPSFQANSGGSAISTINGDSGSITGTTVTIYANNAATNCGKTVLFDNSASTSTLNVTDSFNNTTVGLGAASSLAASGNNTVLGYNAFNAAVSGTNGCTIIGSQAGQSINSLGASNNTVVGYLAWSNSVNPALGNSNSIFGHAAAPVLESGASNCIWGEGSGQNLTTGDSNVLINGGDGIVSGSYNIVINSLTNYTGAESKNILLFSKGVLGESNVIRIRDTTCVFGAATSCYIGGIQGVSVSNKQLVTIDTTTGQLGSDATVSVANGGTGASSFNINGVVISNTTTTGALASLTLTDGQIVIGSTGNPPAAATLSAGSGISITNGANSITIASSGGGFSWTDVTGATQTLAINNGYITDRGGGVTYTLPSTASLGDTIKIVGKSGIAVITPNANQQILIGSTSGTVGVTGTATANNAGDCITLICITSGASTVWRAESTIGTWTLA